MIHITQETRSRLSQILANIFMMTLKNRLTFGAPVLKIVTVGGFLFLP